MFQGRAAHNGTLVLAFMNWTQPKTGRTRWTKRQWQVLALMLERKTNKEIAISLNVELTTVRFHSNRIYRRVGAADRWELLQLYLRG